MRHCSNSIITNASFDDFTINYCCIIVIITLLFTCFIITDLSKAIKQQYPKDGYSLEGEFVTFTQSAANLEIESITPGWDVGYANLTRKVNRNSFFIMPYFNDLIGQKQVNIELIIPTY